MKRLWQSAKFWTLVLDVVVSTILFFGAKYLAPSTFEDVKFLVTAMQPVFLLLIGAFAYEDRAAKANTIYPFKP